MKQIRMHLLNGLTVFWKRFRAAFPTIVFFIILFLIIVYLFGIWYAMAISVFTTIFKIQHLRKNTVTYFFKIFFISLLLCWLAYVSSLHPAYCLILNACIPFLLVFLQSSRFNPKGYFSYAMMFIFLELRPPSSISGLKKSFIVVTICAVFLILSLILYSLLFRRDKDKPSDIHTGLLKLAQSFDRLACGHAGKAVREELIDLENKFHSLAYNNHKFIPVKSSQTQLYDMFAILFQRAAYLIHDTTWQDEMDETHIRELHTLADFLRHTEQTINSENNEALIAQAQRMLDEMEDVDGRLRIFFRSFLHMLILILRHVTKEQTIFSQWGRISWDELSVHIKRICSLESLEMRFALRFSIVMTLSFTVSTFMHVTHAYWIPLNAFLLLQPDYEESARRMKTRPIGTIIGCVIEFLIFPHLPGIGGKLIFAVCMLCLMYCAIPGTWNHPIFSTCYALTLASMSSINETTAIELRIIDLLLAIGIVFIVNHFFFPTRRETQFRCNIRELLRLHNSYWLLIRQSLHGLAELSSSSEILTLFHMTYSQAADYIRRKLVPFDPARCRHILLMLWHMFSELEQIEFLIQTESLQPGDYPLLSRTASRIQHSLYPDCSRIAQKDFQLDRFSPDLNYVLKQYLKHARELAQLDVVSLYPIRHRRIRKRGA